VGRPDDGEDVRGAILSAALRQLEEAGSPDRVTVAAIIAEAGCTPPSLYHYWPKRELLLHEASALGWAQFRASQAGAVAGDGPATDPGQVSPPDPGQVPREGADGDPVERLRRRGRAYLDFALARPSLFRVLFLEPAAAGPAGPTAETGQALQDLVADVSAAMATGQFRSADPLTTALAVWSAMHGVAALWAVTPSLPTDLAHAVGNLTQDAFLAGLATQPDAS
jgi:AcrR family transcriptional regulator